LSWSKIYREGKGCERPRAPADTVYRAYAGLGREGAEGLHGGYPKRTRQRGLAGRDRHEGAAGGLPAALELASHSFIEAHIRLPPGGPGATTPGGKDPDGRAGNRSGCIPGKPSPSRRVKPEEARKEGGFQNRRSPSWPWDSERVMYAGTSFLCPIM
jgi:hypothetical protein